MEEGARALPSLQMVNSSHLGIHLSLYWLWLRFPPPIHNFLNCHNCYYSHSVFLWSHKLL